MISSFYKAWEAKDCHAVQSYLDVNLFGVRLFDETVCYTVDDVIAACQQSPKRTYQVFDIVEHDRYITYSLRVTEQNHTWNVLAKARKTEHGLDKIYEQVVQDTTRIRCVCSYDGSSFFGYQKQPKHNTVQQTIEVAIQQALQLTEPVTIHSSGRTDKGVHAYRQVFHFDVKTMVPIEKMTSLLNSYLPDSIFITESTEVPQTFHSRYDVMKKVYQYKINQQEYNPIQRQYEWYVPGMDVDRFRTELTKVIGTHDFQSFTTQRNESTIRTIHSVCVEFEGDYITVHLVGNGFLRYMVRYIIGAAVQIATGKLPYTMTELLEKRDVNLLKDKAPATGLYLADVIYEEVI